ncbi:MAG: D-alanyl-D-alanine carboxypeptidase/D-alanyl-D-alanine-endopeptidase [Acidimicrobiales bacterium]|nr:D-alanyl-D-alanine carboxypeptidase/D-alanyl-D-alanine-endopeptidase [Acidimicrobiales bacterium]
MPRQLTRFLAGLALVLAGCSATVGASDAPQPSTTQAGSALASTSTVRTAAPHFPASATAKLRTPTTPPTTVASTTTPENVEVELRTLAKSSLASRLEISAALWIDGVGEVWSHNPETELFPASNQKLITAAGALQILGPHHRFTTQIRSDGHTLYFVAGGDPTFSGTELIEIARQTAEAIAPIRTLNEVVIDADRYDPATMAPGWQDWQMPTYTGPLSAFTLDDNRWTKSNSFIANPALGNGKRFVEALGHVGVSVVQPPRIGLAPEAMPTIVLHNSAPVSDLVRTMMLTSDNQNAEALLREIDAVDGGTGSTADGLQKIRADLATIGVPVDGQLGDGSGLSRSNRRSARQWIEFLIAVRDAPWFGAFHDNLPVAGRSGTLTGRLTGPATEGNVRAKTGTIIGGRSLSGYFTTPDGRDAAFSITINGDESHAALPLVDDLVVEMISVVPASPS